MSVQVITNVPSANVAGYTTMFLNAGATSVTPAPEDDGEFTLIVVWPDQATLHAMLTGREAPPDEDG